MEHITLLKVYRYDSKLRLGNENDGGYVIADNFGSYDCYISAGVSHEDSFSRDFVPKFQMNKTNSYAFDGTINQYPKIGSNDITFIRKNIGIQNNDIETNLDFLFEKYNNIFLKMDIEGSEYEFLNTMPENNLKKLKQLVMEYHGINDNSFGCLHQNKIKCFTKMNQFFYLVHLHGNNFSYLQNKIPGTIEVTYVRKDLFNGKLFDNINPLPDLRVDRPNQKQKADFNLNFPPFVNFDTSQLYL